MNLRDDVFAVVRQTSDQENEARFSFLIPFWELSISILRVPRYKSRSSQGRTKGRRWRFWIGPLVHITKNERSSDLALRSDVFRRSLIEFK